MVPEGPEDEPEDGGELPGSCCESEIAGHSPCVEPPAHHARVEYLGPAHLCDGCYSAYAMAGYVLGPVAP